MKWRLACAGAVVFVPAIASAGYCWGMFCNSGGQLPSAGIPTPQPNPATALSPGRPYCWGMHCGATGAVVPVPVAGSAGTGSIPASVSGGPYIWQQASVQSSAARAALMNYALSIQAGTASPLLSGSVGGTRAGASWATVGGCTARCGPNEGVCRASRC